MILLNKLKPATRICKECFEPIKDNYPFAILNANACLCEKCDRELKPHFRHFMILKKYHAISFYDYEGSFQKLIYVFKGCYDIELRHIFLERYYRELHFIFHGYLIVPIPSYFEADQLRGFNHVKEIFKHLNLPMLEILDKIQNVKQATSNAKERKEIQKYMKIKKRIDLTNKKILLVDDVYTTGSTMQTAIKLIEKLNPKKINVLVLAKA